MAWPDLALLLAVAPDQPLYKAVVDMAQLLRHLYHTYQVGPRPQCRAIVAAFREHCAPGSVSHYLLFLKEDADRLLEDIWPVGVATFSNDIVVSLIRFHGARGSGKQKATGQSACGRPESSVDSDAGALGQVLQCIFLYFHIHLHQHDVVRHVPCVPRASLESVPHCPPPSLAHPCFPFGGGGAPAKRPPCRAPSPTPLSQKTTQTFPPDLCLHSPARLALGFGLGLGRRAPWHVRHSGCGGGGLWAGLGGLLGGSGGGAVFSLGGLGVSLSRTGRSAKQAEELEVREEEEEEPVEDSEEGSEEDSPGSLLLFFFGGGGGKGLWVLGWHLFCFGGWGLFCLAVWGLFWARGQVLGPGWGGGGRLTSC